LPQAELVERVVQRLSLQDHQPSPQLVCELIFQMGMTQELVMQGHREHSFVCYQNAFITANKI
jgi:hypothetical protein